MKSIRQRLQSRISLRRNTIRQLEAEFFEVRRIARIVQGSTIPHYKQMVKALRSELNFLRDDQKLDKTLYVRLLRDEAIEREYNEMFDTFGL